MSASRPGFTLIELLISTALAMLLAVIATTAFYRFRAIAARAEARLAMHTSAQRLYTQLNRTFACVQPSCAMVASATAGTEVRLVFMRAKEHNWDYSPPSSASGLVDCDLVWEEWVWTRADSTLRSATSSGGSAPGRSFVSGGFAPKGVDYSGKTFRVLPQPRRILDPATPFAATAPGLNDNVLFPSAANPADIGDFTDLENGLIPVSDQVTDLSIELVCHDGTSLVLDDAGTVPTRVFQGVWLDGRLASTLDAPPVYAGSDLAKRPRTLRLRFSLTSDPAHPERGVTCPFSFSFALPDLSPRP